MAHEDELLDLIARLRDQLRATDLILRMTSDLTVNSVSADNAYLLSEVDRYTDTLRALGRWREFQDKIRHLRLRHIERIGARLTDYPDPENYTLAIQPRLRQFDRELRELWAEYPEFYGVDKLEVDA